MSYRMSYGNRTAYGRGFVESAMFTSLNDVQKVLDILDKKIEQNSHVTMADYYETIGAVVLPDDSKWGWTTLLECNITRTRRGFELCMPVTVLLQRNPAQDAYNALCEAESAEAEDVPGIIEDAKSYLSSVL